VPEALFEGLEAFEVGGGGAGVDGVAEPCGPDRPER
jgi:hypothetical protein